MSSSSRFKKDKEIVAEYESQVKGKKAGVGQDARSLFLFIPPSLPSPVWLRFPALFVPRTE